jgi:hypothetical protein
MNNKKNKSIDIFRHNINNLLKNNVDKNEFNIFLNNDEFNFFNIWFSICSANNNFNIYLNELKRLINIYYQSKNIISFKKLFNLNKKWYEFYYTSADINGRILPNEKRLGVNKLHATDIQKIVNINKNINFDDAILFYTKLNYIINNN